MLPRPRGYSLIAFAFTLPAAGVAYLGLSTPGQRPAHEPAMLPARLLHAVEGRSCTLPIGQQIKAVNAFKEMIPVFRHPRCFNCHGGFDITDSVRHEGAEAVPEGVNPRAPLTVPQRQALHENCGGCHSEIHGEMKRFTKTDTLILSGWMVAPEGMLWVGKSDETLCLDMKRHEAVPDSFVDHMESDHKEVQFIEAAFLGVRALSPTDPTRNGIVPEPPPGNQAALVAKAKKWVQLVGGEWKEGPGTREPSECGCVMPKIKLQVHHKSAIDPNHLSHRMGDIGFSGDANFEVTLTAMHEAQGRVYYTGTNSLVRPLQVYHVRRDCKGTASEREDWVWTAEVDTSQQMKLHWGFTTSDEKGESVCIVGGYRDVAPLDPSIFDGTSDEPLVMPLDNGATKQITAKEENGSGQVWMTIKVLAAP